jgi:hypothetical protein
MQPEIGYWTSELTAETATDRAGLTGPANHERPITLAVVQDQLDERRRVTQRQARAETAEFLRRAIESVDDPVLAALYRSQIEHQIAVVADLEDRFQDP